MGFHLIKSSVWYANRLRTIKHCWLVFCFCFLDWWCSQTISKWGAPHACWAHQTPRTHAHTHITYNIVFDVNVQCIVVVWRVFYKLALMDILGIDRCPILLVVSTGNVCIFMQTIYGPAAFFRFSNYMCTDISEWRAFTCRCLVIRWFSNIFYSIWNIHTICLARLFFYSQVRVNDATNQGHAISSFQRTFYPQ